MTFIHSLTVIFTGSEYCHFLFSAHGGRRTAKDAFKFFIEECLVIEPAMLHNFINGKGRVQNHPLRRFHLLLGLDFREGFSCFLANKITYVIIIIAEFIRYFLQTAGGVVLTDIGKNTINDLIIFLLEI